MEQVRLGGVDQSVVIRGQNFTDPESRWCWLLRRCTRDGIS
jgi:hypothetical protein